LTFSPPLHGIDGEYSPKASLIFQLIKTIKSSHPVMSAGRELSSEEEVKNPAAPAPILGYTGGNKSKGKPLVTGPIGN